MTENNFQWGKGWNWQKIVFIPLFIMLAVVAVFFALSIFSFPDINWVSTKPENPTPSLEIAVMVLTILVAVVAVFWGFTTERLKKDWHDFVEKRWEKSITSV